MKTVGIVVVVASVTACGAAYHDNVDLTLTSHRPTVVSAPPPPPAPDPHPGGVGQWVLYKVSRGGGTVGYQLAGITRGSCGIWFEYVWASDESRVISKVCYRTMPDLAARPDSWSKLVQLAVTKVDDDWPVVVDLRDSLDQPIGRRLQIERFHDTIDSRRWRSDGLPREDVDVVGGHFAQAIRASNPGENLTMWFHPAVPIVNLIKAHTGDGSDIELVAFGEAGAKSVIANIPEGSDDYIECKQRPVVGSNIWKPVCLPKSKSFEEAAVLKNQLGAPTASPRR